MVNACTEMLMLLRLLCCVSVGNCPAECSLPGLKRVEVTFLFYVVAMSKAVYVPPLLMLYYMQLIFYEILGTC